MSISERKALTAQDGQAKRPKLGLKYGAGQLSERPMPRLEGAR